MRDILQISRKPLADLLQKAEDQLGELTLCPVITGSGGLTLANHLEVPFVQEVIAVSTSLQKLAPKTDVAIELGGEDAKIIYFEKRKCRAAYEWHLCRRYRFLH